MYSAKSSGRNALALRLRGHAPLRDAAQLRDCLCRHFIFGPLARHTAFLADLAAATGVTLRPEEIAWRPVLTAS